MWKQGGSEREENSRVEPGLGAGSIRSGQEVGRSAACTPSMCGGGSGGGRSVQPGGTAQAASVEVEQGVAAAWPGEETVAAGLAGPGGRGRAGLRKFAKLNFPDEDWEELRREEILLLQLLKNDFAVVLIFLALLADCPATRNTLLCTVSSQSP